MARYGCSVNTMAGLMMLSVALMISLCLLVRYSAEVTVMAPAIGITVTVVASAAEAMPAEFVATTCTKIVCCVPPSGMVGVKFSAHCVVDVVPLQVSGRVGSPPTPTGGVAVYDQVTSTFSPPGSTPVATMLVGVPDCAMTGDTGTYDTVGALGALTVMVAVALAEVVQAVTVKVAVTVAGPAGAVNNGLRTVALDSDPPVTAHEKVGAVPPAVPFRVTVPPEATWYGPPAVAVGGEHPSGVGTTVPGHGLRAPVACTPVVEKYPPCAKKGTELKSDGGTGVPGIFSTKMYSAMGALYDPEVSPLATVMGVDGIAGLPIAGHAAPVIGSVPPAGHAGVSMTAFTSRVTGRKLPDEFMTHCLSSLVGTVPNGRHGGRKRQRPCTAPKGGPGSTPIVPQSRSL